MITENCYAIYPRIIINRINYNGIKVDLQIPAPSWAELGKTYTIEIKEKQ